MSITIEQFDLIKNNVRENRDSIEHSLTLIGRQWLKENYNVRLTHDVAINARLTRSMGRISIGHYGITDIELSEAIVMDYKLTNDSDKLMGVLKHELIHYALYKLRLPYKDSDRYFKEQCRLHGAPLSIPGVVGLMHEYKCNNGHKINRKRKIDTNRYVCACDGKLEYQGKVVRLS